MLLHIISTSDLDRSQASGEISPPSLDSEGFVHCSYPDQLLIPANERFRGRRDLVVLVLDASVIEPPLVVEDSYGSGTLFPHVYGPIPIQAIERVIEFQPEPDGSFELPALIRDQLPFEPS